MFKQNLTPCFLFDGQAQEAAKFYVSVFKKSKILYTSPVITRFRILGQDFVALNGPQSQFSWAMSHYVACKTQKEIDYYWAKLSAGGGEEQPCGWVKDRFGVSWQIVPAITPDLLEHKNRKKADAVMQTVMTMKKLDLAKMKAAFAGAGK